jgi:hypothetical protein
MCVIVFVMLARTAGGAGVGRLLSDGSVFASGLTGGAAEWSTLSDEVRFLVSRVMTFRMYIKGDSWKAGRSG